MHGRSRTRSACYRCKSLSLQNAAPCSNFEPRNRHRFESDEPLFDVLNLRGFFPFAGKFELTRRAQPRVSFCFSSTSSLSGGDNASCLSSVVRAFHQRSRHRSGRLVLDSGARRATRWLGQSREPGSQGSAGAGAVAYPLGRHCRVPNFRVRTFFRARRIVSAQRPLFIASGAPWAGSERKCHAVSQEHRNYRALAARRIRGSDRHLRARCVRDIVARPRRRGRGAHYHRYGHIRVLSGLLHGGPASCRCIRSQPGW